MEHPADRSAATSGTAAMGWLRAAVGVAMIAAPNLVVPAPEGAPPPGSLAFMVRTIGVRDLAIGLGTVAAARAAAPDDMRRWLRYGLLSDALDVVAGATAGRLLGRGGATAAALIPVPFVAADLGVLRTLTDRS